MEEAIATAGACRVFGKSRATLYRHRNPAPRTEGPRRKPSPHPAGLSEDERAHVLAVLDSPEFADKSPGQVYAILLDRGVYLCSEATMYRLLRERGQSGERRAQAAHPAKKKPELMADGPDQVWSWDITKLKGPARGIWYLLYVIIDIYSRKVIHWEAWPTENGTLAKEFIEHAIEANGGSALAGLGVALDPHGPVHGYRAGLEVDLVPRYRPGLLSADPGEQGQHHVGREPVSAGLDGLQESDGLP